MISQKKPQFKIFVEDKEEMEFEMNFDQINHYVQAMTLTPIYPQKVESLEVKKVHFGGMKPFKFHRASSSFNFETPVNLEDTFSNKLMEFPFGYYSAYIQKLVQQGCVPRQMSKEVLHLFEKLWNTKSQAPNSIEGVGFDIEGSVDDSEFCIFVTNSSEDVCLDLEDNSKDGPIEDALQNLKKKSRLQQTS